MNRSKYVVIYGLKSQGLKENIAMLNAVFLAGVDDENCAMCENVMVVSLGSVSAAQKLISDVNQSSTQTQACFLDFFNKIVQQKPRNYEPVARLDERKLMSRVSVDNELFVIHHEGKLSLFENDMTGKVKDVGEEKGVSRFVVSNTSKFVALLGPTLVLKYGSSFDPFYELFFEAESVEFSENDVYLAVHGRKETSVWVLDSMRRVLETEATEVVFDEANERFFLKILGKFVDAGGSAHEPEYSIDKLSVNKSRMAILTQGDIKNIILVAEGEVLKKSQQNVSEVTFQWSKSFLFAAKTVLGKKELSFLECYGNEKILMYQSDNGISDFKVSDDYAVICDRESCLIFLQRKRTLVEIARVKKVNRVLISMNTDGKVVAVYDNESDSLEFYGEGALIAVHKNTYCTGLQWSPSGLFLASISGAGGFNGTIQMLTSNGRVLWKKGFNMMASFQWCPYADLDDASKAEVISDYRALANDLPMDYLEYTTEEDNVERLKEAWLAFLKKKRSLAARRTVA